MSPAIRLIGLLSMYFVVVEVHSLTWALIDGDWAGQGRVQNEMRYGSN